MRNISQFIYVLFLILFFSNESNSQTEEIKNIQLFGTKRNTQKSVFYKGEIINVSFDELSYNTNNYYYSIDHYDYDWNKSNIFKNEIISGYDDIRISDYKKSFNTLQKFTNYSFSFPNEKFTILLSGNYLLTVKDYNDNIIFQRKFIIVEKGNIGNIEISRSKDINKRNSYQNLKIKFRCIECVFDTRSKYKLVVLQNNNFNNYQLINNSTLKTSTEMIFDNILFKGGDEYLSFDNKNILITNNEIKQILTGNIYSTILYEDIENLSYSYNPDKNGIFINNTLSQNKDLESDYTKVSFSIRTNSDQDNDVYIVGGFNNHELIEENKLKKTKNNLYEKTIKLKQGYYNYMYVKSSNGLIESLSNFWQTENDYSAFLFQKKPIDRFYKIVGYTKKNSDNIVN